MLECYIRNRFWHIPSPSATFRRKGYFDLLDSDKTVLDRELHASDHGCVMSGLDAICDNARHYLDYAEFGGPQWASETEDRALTVKDLDASDRIIVAHNCVVGIPVELAQMSVDRFLATPFPTVQRCPIVQTYLMVRARRDGLVHLACVEAWFRPEGRLFTYVECFQNADVLSRLVVQHLSSIGVESLT